MKKYILPLLLLFTACSNPSPEKYFDEAVLNTNMFSGFAGEGMARELESPSVKMGKTKDEYAPMKRAEVVSEKISFIEESFEKIKGLKETADSKEILQNSIALYNYVLPVYKNEYVQLAKIYDGGGSKEQIRSMLQSIQDKYYARYDELYNKLINSGKLYADKHSIKVNWDIHTSPY